MGKCLVINAVVKLGGVDIVRLFQSWHTDSVWAHAVDSLKVLRVHNKSSKLIFIQLQAKQYAKTYVVNTALHGAVHSFGVVVVVVLRACGVELLI